jgi:D-psicose/D-tagatose/L-ribulose 3-epimerase
MCLFCYSSQVRHLGQGFHNCCIVLDWRYFGSLAVTIKSTAVAIFAEASLGTLIMKLGIHAYAWCSTWSNETLPLIDRVKALGLDFIELPLMHLDTFDSPAIVERLKANDLGVCTSTVLLSGFDISSTDIAERTRGIQYLKNCVAAANAVGATNLSGVVYGEHAKPNATKPTNVEWGHVADSLRDVANYALEHGVQIGIEPVNRYETSLVNTCEQARSLQKLIGCSNVKIHLDTYHMNIEEKDFYAATVLAGGDLIHYHLCENDRGIPGTGLVDWDGIFRALAKMNYQGNAALESFVDATDNMNTWVWRKLAPDGDTLVREGIAFIREKQAKYFGGLGND